MLDRKVTVLDAPSNLGLRPPEAGSVPGCYKLPWALRDQNLLQLLMAEDAGVVVPPRYRSHWSPGEGDRNAKAIAAYSVELAERLENYVDKRRFLVVLGGDCSILLGTALALKQRGRYGLMYIDAHGDFRHPGNSETVGAAGGEALAIVSGRGDSRLIDLRGLGPSVLLEDVHVLGVRDDDDYLDEVSASGGSITTSSDVTRLGVASAASSALQTVTRHAEGFWVHLDIDVLDSSEMPAVDCPEPRGLLHTDLGDLLAHIVGSPECVGIEVTIFDPDLDVSGRLAARLVKTIAGAFLASK